MQNFGITLSEYMHLSFCGHIFVAHAVQLDMEDHACTFQLRWRNKEKVHHNAIHA